MKLVAVNEREAAELPIADVLGSDGKLNLLPEVTKHGYLDIDFRNGNLVLVAGRFVGRIPVSENIALDVRPKVPVSRLGRMLELSQQPLSTLDFYKRSYRLDDERNEPLVQAMARSLCLALREVQREGMHREYVANDKSGESPRGKILIGASAQRFWSRGLYSKVACRQFELTNDSPLNRVLKRAILAVGYQLAGSSTADKTLISELADFADLFESVPLDMSESLLTTARRAIATRALPTLRHYYYDVCDISLALLAQEGVGLLGAGEDARLHSFVLNMEDLFEHYVLAVLKASSALANANILAADGNGEAKKPFFKDTARFEAKPDIVLSRAGAVIAILDAKYKLKSKEEDRYQIISHSLSYGAHSAVLIMPKSEAVARGPIRLGKLGDAHVIDVYIYGFDLEAADSAVEESELATFVLTLAPPPA